MRTESAYRYQLLVGERPLGPYDRRTIVGMRIRSLIDGELRVKRSDGHVMTVAQLLADRFEMADAESLDRYVAAPPASGVWPTFLIDCGGSFLKPGALGFIGKGELRFQGDFLRITANRKSGMVSTRNERSKVILRGIASAAVDPQQRDVVILTFKPGYSLEEVPHLTPAHIRLDDADSVRELLELMNLS